MAAFASSVAVDERTRLARDLRSRDARSVAIAIVQRDGGGVTRPRRASGARAPDAIPYWTFAQTSPSIPFFRGSVMASAVLMCVATPVAAANAALAFGAIALPLYFIVLFRV